jgi:pyruvate dehydrogenase E1 component alpha subunit
MDVIAVYEAVEAALKRARAGEGPTLVECKTYRFYDHVGVRGMGLTYRTDQELETWKKRDAIIGFEARLLELGVVTQKGIVAIYAGVNAEIEEAIQFAEDSPFPEAHEMLEDVYSERAEA